LDGGGGDGDTSVDDGAVLVDSGEDGSAPPDGSVDSGGGDGSAPTVLGTWVLIDVNGTPFTMGSPRTELGRDTDEPEYPVTLTRNYWLMETEITQQQYLEVMGYNPSSLSGCGMDCPVEQVNWHEVAAYANALSVLDGLGECYRCTGTTPSTMDCVPSSNYATPYQCPGYRLPTEAEWEYAARGGTTTATYAGELTSTQRNDDTLPPIAWFVGNAGNTTHPVGTRSGNAYGLFDMLGNVWEWCHDWYAVYPDVAVTDPTGPPGGAFRVIRGGSWPSVARDVRAANRNSYLPGDRYPDFGGRVARTDP
jgi:formylglycine-generating enzyme required for sulfatase activity